MNDILLHLYIAFLTVVSSAVPESRGVIANDARRHEAIQTKADAR
jgi:hypothetical protein